MVLASDVLLELLRPGQPTPALDWAAWLGRGRHPRPGRDPGHDQVQGLPPALTLTDVAGIRAGHDRRSWQGTRGARARLGAAL